MNRRQAAATLLLFRRKKYNQKYWVHPINRTCKDLGEFHTLYKDLRKYPDRFYTYYRMSIEQFDTILAQIEHLIYKPNSKWQHSISLEEKLAICIRVLSLQYCDEFVMSKFALCVSRHLEGVMNSRDCWFEFLNRSVPIYPEKEIILKPDEQKLVRIKAPFVDEISGMAIIKIIDGGTYSTLFIKLKFTHNKAILDLKNTGKDTIILRPEEMIGIVDIRSLGYYQIKQGILW